MSVTLSPELEAIIRDKVERGLYASPDEAIAAAVRLLDDHDRRLGWLRAELAIGEEQEKRGDLIDFTPELLDQLSREAEENARQGKPIADAVTPCWS